mgnify:CR=1 FL=1
MARNNQYSKELRRLIIQEFRVKSTKDGLTEALRDVRNIAKKCYFEVQTELKNTQEKYHEFGTMEYYAKQSALLKDYELAVKRTNEEWEKKLQLFRER